MFFFIDHSESQVLNILTKLFGEERAIVLEHLIIMIFSIIFGYLLCILTRSIKLRVEDGLRIRFTKQLNQIFYLNLEKDEFQELLIRTPRNLFQKVEMYVMLNKIRYYKEDGVLERKIKRTSIFVFIMFILFSLFIIVTVLFILNTAGNHAV